MMAIAGQYDETKHKRTPAGQPGGGQYADKPGETATSDRTKELSAEAKFDYVRDRAKQLGKDLDFDGDVLIYRPDVVYDFSVGGQKFTAGGIYQAMDNTVAIYSNSFIDSSGTLEQSTEWADRMLPGVMAHEVMHGKFVAVQRALEDERAAIQNDPEIWEEKYPVGTSGHKDVGMAPDGTLRTPELQNKYKIYTRFEAFQNSIKGGLSSVMEELRKEDGNTAYSEAYWQPELLSKSYGEWRAINETLAEMASKDYRNKLAGNKALLLHKSPFWIKYYKLFQQSYKELQKDPERLKQIRASFKERPFYG